MTQKAWIGDFLESRQVPYLLRHHKNVYESQRLAGEEGIKGKRVAKVVMAMSGDSPVMLVLPSSRYVDLDKASRQTGKPGLRLASEEEMARHFPESEVGAVPPLQDSAHHPETPIFLDDRSFAKDQVLFPAGSHWESVLMDYHDWVHVTHPTLAQFATVRRPAGFNGRFQGLLRYALVFIVLVAAAVASYFLYRTAPQFGFNFKDVALGAFSLGSTVALGVIGASIALSVLALPLMGMTIFMMIGAMMRPGARIRPSFLARLPHALSRGVWPRRYSARIPSGR